MTPKEYRAFADALKKADIKDVRESADPALEPDAIKRDIAITELARRAQALESKNVGGSIFVQSIFWIIIAISLAGVAIWTLY
jgi:hypothetical protein